MAEWTQKQDPHICCIRVTHFRSRDTHRLKVRRRENASSANGNQKKTELAIFISDKIDFKIETVTRDKEGQYITIKTSIQEEETTIVIYTRPTQESSVYKANTTVVTLQRFLLI